MISSGGTDRFEIINGPEDGCEFPLLRSPADLGNTPACIVQVRMDTTVNGLLARATVVSDGYRIRRMGGGTLLADGRRVGRIRSRILRHGGTLTLGDTELVLQTAMGGLASRSHGMPQESDAAWALRLLTRRISFFFRRSGGMLLGLLPSPSGTFLLVAALAAGALLLLPNLRLQTLYVLQSLWTYARYFMSWFG